MPTTEAVFRASILPFTLHEEGGYSKDRNDPGNWTGGKVGAGVFKGTKYGIAANSHPNLDIKNLTLDQACNIYWNEYMPAWCRDLDPALCMVIFDCNVNCGSGKGRKVLAVAQKASGLLAQVKAASAANLSYHRSLSTWGRYGKVWGGRIERCQAQALKIMAGSQATYPKPTDTSEVPPVPKPKHTVVPQEPQEAPAPAPATTVAPSPTTQAPESPQASQAPTLGEVLWTLLKGLFHARN